MKKLILALVAAALVPASSTAYAGWGYAVRGPGVVVRPVVPAVTYYAPVVPAPVVAPAPVVVPVPPPSPVLTPEALVYPGMVVYPVPAVRARAVYRPAVPVYGVIVP